MSVGATNAALAVRRVEANLQGRDWAVGDIHGCFSLLQQGLDALGFDPATDRLFSVGDLVDRGPESAQVCDWLDQAWFFAIVGNHELMTWRRALGHPLSWVDHREHGGLWLDDLSNAEQQRLGQRLAALPRALEVQTEGGLVGLVHADLPSDDWADVPQLDWRAGQLERMGSAAGRCIWVSERLRYGYKAKVAQVRAVVHGHTTLPHMVQLGNVYFIDTGGWRAGGRFTFLNLHTLQATLGPLHASA